MENHSQNFKIRLGLFIVGGITLFVLAIFIIGKQKNLFNPVYSLTTNFYNVGGLKVGSKIRFSGIDVGTVDHINIINDSTVKVNLFIRKEIQPFIKNDSQVTIGAEGLIGDKILLITQGTNTSPSAKEGQYLSSIEPVEIEAIMVSLQSTAENAEIISNELAEIMIKINSGNGTLGRLIQDSLIAENLSQTMLNLKKSSKGLDENMEAAKHNFLLKGYFNKKEKAAAKKLKEAEEKKRKEAEEKTKAKN